MENINYASFCNNNSICYNSKHYYIAVMMVFEKGEKWLCYTTCYNVYLVTETEKPVVDYPFANPILNIYFGILMMHAYRAFGKSWRIT